MFDKLLGLYKYLDKVGLSSEARLVSSIHKKIAQEVYIVEPGDNLTNIAQQYYGKASYYRYIKNEDGTGIKGPLQIGQKLLLTAGPSTPNSSMSYSQNLVEFLKRHESLQLSAYNDGVGNTTIGYGHNIGKIPLSRIRNIS